MDVKPHQFTVRGRGGFDSSRIEQYNSRRKPK